MIKNLYYWTILNDIKEKTNKDITDYIDSVGDVQKHQTNVKANMTKWCCKQLNGFDVISKRAKHLSKFISINEIEADMNPVVGEVWGMKYKSGDYAVPHDHWPAIFSFAYYINPPDNSTLYFPNINRELVNKHKMLVLFHGYATHEVLPKKFENYRYVVSGNIHHKEYNKNGL